MKIRDMIAGFVDGLLILVIAPDLQWWQAVSIVFFVILINDIADSFKPKTV